ncbi:hypothetical protein B0H10DRAFT_1984576 [Mycena sp. CBHHK59/15]|nr:hypothetical protein B0H10DRAFT_1984576 [Mycena sp. CBHHK59/15]
MRRSLMREVLSESAKTVRAMRLNDPRRGSRACQADRVGTTAKHMSRALCGRLAALIVRHAVSRVLTPHHVHSTCRPRGRKHACLQPYMPPPSLSPHGSKYLLFTCTARNGAGCVGVGREVLCESADTAQLSLSKLCTTSRGYGYTLTWAAHKLQAKPCSSCVLSVPCKTAPRCPSSQRLHCGALPFAVLVSCATRSAGTALSASARVRRVVSSRGHAVSHTYLFARTTRRAIAPTSDCATRESGCLCTPRAGRR